MSSSVSEVGSRTTFKGLFEAHKTVQIPIIQRDFAQGRASEREIRDEFLGALHTALSKPTGDPSLPLDLDFVYGTIEADGKTAFAPLDGQQRLTTLFLLHWYLAWIDDAKDDFSSFIRDGEYSRFTYAVRPSSQEFFNSLVKWFPKPQDLQDVALAEQIVDQTWFFRSWRSDPTIQSVLQMLDAIHKRFGSANGFYARLINTDTPFVTFQLLNLKAFGLSDDLYIKMNARGKPLTAFETFKARLEKHIGTIPELSPRELQGRTVSPEEYFSHQVDTTWADIFWQYRDDKTNLFDEKFMQLVRAIATVTRDPDTSNADKLLGDLRSSWQSFSFLRYQEAGCLDKPFLELLTAVLDAWSANSAGISRLLDSSCSYDEEKAFRNVIADSTRVNYAELIQFYAYCSYILIYRPAAGSSSFSDWMRVVVNLTSNSPYDGLDDFKRSMRSINNMLSKASSILPFLASVPSIQGFLEQQIREEQLKAQLLLKSQRWQEIILSAERHKYFAGQIEFLFQFAGVLTWWKQAEDTDWSSDQDDAFYTKFEDYLRRGEFAFSERGALQSHDFAWERSLLTVGNYLLPSGKNLHFLQATGRDTSWKRLLRSNMLGIGDAETKRGYVKDLLDKIDLSTDLDTSLFVVTLAAPATNDWRESLIRLPGLIEYCYGRMIRFISPQKIYLLRKQRINGEHAELYTYALYLEKLSDLSSMAPLSSVTYISSSSESIEPMVRFQGDVDGRTLSLTVENGNGDFLLNLTVDGEELPIEISDRLRSIPSVKYMHINHYRIQTPQDEVETAIDSILQALRPVGLLLA